MKKVNENTVDPFFGIVITENEKIDNPKLRKRLEILCNSLKNCNNKLVYIDERNWYIQID